MMAGARTSHKASTGPFGISTDYPSSGFPDVIANTVRLIIEELQSQADE
jgi:hypothetical protein